MFYFKIWKQDFDIIYRQIFRFGNRILIFFIDGFLDLETVIFLVGRFLDLEIIKIVLFFMSKLFENMLFGYCIQTVLPQWQLNLGLDITDIPIVITILSWKAALEWKLRGTFIEFITGSFEL